MECLEEIKKGSYVIKVYADDHAESPRDWDNVGTMVCNHRRYTLGDKQIDSSYANNWKEELAYYVLGEYSTGLSLPTYDMYGYFENDKELDRVWKWIENNLIVLPLYLYDHSGITMSTGSFSCKWDSGQVGFIYCTKERAIKEWGNKIATKNVIDKAIKYMTGEVETYAEYLEGNVYEYRVEDKDGEVIGSCSGFYGYDHNKSGLIDHAEADITCEIKSRLKARFTKLKQFIKSKVSLEIRWNLLTEDYRIC